MSDEEYQAKIDAAEEAAQEEVDEAMLENYTDKMKADAAGQVVVEKYEAIAVQAEALEQEVFYTPEGESASVAANIARAAATAANNAWLGVQPWE